MKLPDNRADRIKILVLAVVGTAAVIYGVVFGGIRPLLLRKSKLSGDIERIRGDLDRAKVMISRVESTQKDNDAVVGEVLDSSSRNVLQARHGNYLIGARRIVEQAAAPAGVNIVSVTELGVSTLELREAAAGQAAERAFKSYTAEVSARGSLHGLIETLNALEKSNPLLCVSKLQINADEKNPERHQILLRIQWPIWATPETEESLREQISKPPENEAGPPAEEHGVK